MKAEPPRRSPPPGRPEILFLQRMRIGLAISALILVTSFFG
jgi:hypothetical protein